LAHVGQQLLALLTVVPVLLLGGRMRAVLLGNIVVVALTVLLLSRTLRPLGVRGLHFDRSALKALFGLGTPFVFFDLAMVLLPNVNATFLSRLVPPEVIGWYGVSQRLIGLLIFPATALVGALYPTLCRLQAESSSEFARVSRDSIYGTALLAVPAAVGCGLFPEVGVSIFGRDKFAGALAHLQVMSAFIFLVYFSMPIGTAILAANKQRAWALVQSSCIIVALCGNPFLIPYFQRVTGNGAIGTCVTLVGSEAFVVGCGIALLPRGVFNLQLVRALLAASASGVAMGLVAWFTKPISIFVALPAAVLTYALAAYFSGAVQPSTIEMIKGVVSRKILRRA
jgi:O-antigen/teichoic acid export membrane protein